MLHVGQHSTFPKLLFIANRMKIERLIDEGLTLSRQIRQASNDTLITPQDEDRPHLGGQDLRHKIESFSTEEPQTPGSPIRRSSAMEEFQRQSGVFFDDPEADGENTDDSVDGDSDNETPNVE